MVVTREPGGTLEGRFIRSLLLDQAADDLDPTAELILYSEDRRVHVEKVIRPALESGRVVFCDRYYDSTLAYQGAGRKLPGSIVREWATGGGDFPAPDLTVLLDCPVETGFRRLRRRGRDRDRMERERREFHRRVRGEFLSLARRDRRRFVVIDASLSERSVLNAAARSVLDRL